LAVSRRMRPVWVATTRRRHRALAFEFQTARRYAFVFSRRDAPELCINSPSFKKRGRRESRMPIAPAVVRTKGARVDHRLNRIAPAFPARMVYGLLRALPGDRLVCHRRLRGLTIHPEPGWAGCISARLDASIGAPGPHDFAVRDHLTPKVLPDLVPSGEFWQRRLAASFVRTPADRSREDPPCDPLRARRCRVHRIPPRVRDVSRSAPHRVGRGELVMVICPTC
jgi:hypothetical protein